MALHQLILEIRLCDSTGQDLYQLFNRLIKLIISLKYRIAEITLFKF